MARKHSAPASWLVLIGMPASALFLYLFGKLLSHH
jgi:hypothetical protein